MPTSPWPQTNNPQTRMHQPKPPAEVLHAFAQTDFPGLAWELLPQSGYSGAWLWRGATALGALFVLKAHAQTEQQARLATGHRFLKLAELQGEARLTYPLPTRSSDTLLTHAGLLWELLPWRSGTSVRPGAWVDDSVAGVMRCLAEVHTRWRGHTTWQHTPAIVRRLSSFREWLLQPPAQTVDTNQAWHVVQDAAPRLLQQAEALHDQALACQPVLMDCRPEHFLFDAGAVCAVLDCSGVAVDHPAVDLARFLGEVLGAHHPGFATAVELYNQHSQNPVDVDLTHWLAKSGLVAALARWCRLLTSTPTPQAQQRLSALLHINSA